MTVTARRAGLRSAAAGLALALALAPAASCGPATSNFVFDGQSHNLTPGPLLAYPARTMESRDDAWSVAAVGGASWTQLAPTAAERAQPSGGHDVLVLLGGTTDLVWERDSAEEVYAEVVAYADDARRRGFDAVVVLTVPPTTALDGQPGQEAERRRLNEMLLGSGEFDAAVDVELAGCVADPTSACYSDGTHWTAGGAAEVAHLVGPTLDAVKP